MIKVRTFADTDALTRELARLIAAQLGIPGPANEPFALMLAGGRTPLAAYQAVADLPIQVSHAAYFLLSDERMVPSGSPESNFSRIAPLFSALDVPRNRLLVVDTERAPSEAAREYSRELHRFFASGGRITLGLLGLGEDGHTASLFTRQDVERGADAYAVAVERPDGRAGVSVTPDLIRRIEQIIFVAAGAPKRKSAQTLVSAPLSMAAGLAVADHPSVQLWLDAAASPV